jgi:TetR/AcrR family transcriptional regulator
MHGKVLDQSTADKIKEAAKTIFIDRGYDGATMQAIADLAGFNKAQLHYYFRNKDNLFLLIFKEEMVKLIQANRPLITGEGVTLKARLNAWIDTESQFLDQYYKLPIFILNEVQRNPTLVQDFFKDVMVPDIIKSFMAGNSELEMRKSPVSIEDLVTMALSLMIFPLASEPLLKFFFKMDDSRWREVKARQIDFAKGLLDRYLGEE